jgi:hypothetical protein
MYRGRNIPRTENHVRNKCPAAHVRQPSTDLSRNLQRPVGVAVTPRCSRCRWILPEVARDRRRPTQGQNAASPPSRSGRRPAVTTSCPACSTPIARAPAAWARPGRHRRQPLIGQAQLLDQLVNAAGGTPSALSRSPARQSRRPHHAGELRQLAIGRSITAKVTAKWLRAFYGESRLGAGQLVANEYEPAVHILDHDEVLTAKGHSASTVKVTCQHAERVALLEAFDGHECMLDSA